MDNAAKWSQYFDEPNPGLAAYFSHVREGNQDEYRTPFYKGKSLQTVLRNWNRTLVTIKSSWPTLYEFENDLGKKVGPMSIMRPLDERISDIDSYYDSISLESTPISEEAIHRACDEWKRLGSLSIRNQKSTVDLMKKSTNSGSPYFTKRRSVVAKTTPCMVQQNGELCFQNLNGDMWKGAAVLGWRGQEGGPKPEDVKQRVVWMFPFAVNIQELQVYQPLIERMQTFNKVPAWVSMDAVDREITELFDTKGFNDLVICTDFTKFDQHFNKHLQDCAKQCLSYLFRADGSINQWLDQVFPIKYHIPLAFDYGKIRFGAHGMGSGSGGTNADETLAHRCLQHEAAASVHQVLNPHSMCLGDDGVLSYPGCSIDDVVQAYSQHGLDMNTDKQYASKHDCVYLRRWHHDQYRENGICVGVYSTNRALGRLCEQERFYDSDKWSNKMVALRQLSIIENCKYHPLREEFAEYCMKGDKYRLGIDIPGFLDNISNIAKEAIDYMPDFLGYTKSLQNDGHPENTGISDWWIVKYLKSKA